MDIVLILQLVKYCHHNGAYPSPVTCQILPPMMELIYNFSLVKYCHYNEAWQIALLLFKYCHKN